MVVVVLPDASVNPVSPAHDVKYWRGIEALVSETMTPPLAAKIYPTGKKKPSRGLGFAPSGTDAGEQEL